MVGAGFSGGDRPENDVPGSPQLSRAPLSAENLEQINSYERRIRVSTFLTGRTRPSFVDKSVRRTWRRLFFAGADDLSGRAPLRVLIDAFRTQHPNSAEELAWLIRSYYVAAYLHDGQVRKSGGPYITHPLAVAIILAEMGMDATTIVAALLHDTVEDTDYTLAECQLDFGSDVALIVDGVTKLSSSQLDKEMAERETFRKTILAASADLRVLLIKLVDRLHNLRTLGAQPRHKQVRIAKKTMDLLVPFCDRLGLYRLKREMEDLAFRYVEPDDFRSVVGRIHNLKSESGNYFSSLTKVIRERLGLAEIKATVSAMPRHFYSIYRANKGNLPNLSLGQTSRVVVVVEGAERECWIALGVIHQSFRPITGSMRDYISTPKYNLYQSLHTSVFGPAGEPIDMLIRNAEMQEIAEDGIAATIRNSSRKVPQGAQGNKVFQRSDLDWLQRLLSWQGHTPTEGYLDELSVELRGGRIIVVADTGELVSLPYGATGVDYAFSRGSHLGSRLIGLRINGRLAAVTAKLNNGDLVETITSKDGQPAPEWLPTVQTAQARQAIRAFLDRTEIESFDQDMKP